VTRGRRKSAARYLRALATLEVLIAEGSYVDARRVVDGIDPIEAQALADELDPKSGAGRGTGRSTLRLLSAPVSPRKPW